MGSKHFGPPPQILAELMELSGARLFVETGTYLGNTALLASELFRAVITIENDTRYIDKARTRCMNKSNILVIFGDSAEELVEIAKSIRRPAIFWLDAHIMRGENGKPGDCPVLEELDALRQVNGDSYIMIDDASIYASERKGWPSLEEVKDKLGETHNVRVAEDVIVGIPRNGVRQ